MIEVQRKTRENKETWKRLPKSTLTYIFIIYLFSFPGINCLSSGFGFSFIALIIFLVMALIFLFIYFSFRLFCFRNPYHGASKKHYGDLDNQSE